MPKWKTGILGIHTSPNWGFATFLPQSLVALQHFWFLSAVKISTPMQLKHYLPYLYISFLYHCLKEIEPLLMDK